jgi:hypothetical protein
MGDFLKALKTVADSPLALVGYIGVLASWLIAALQDKKSGQVIRALKELPEDQRLQALRWSYKTVPRDGISAEQWLRSKRYAYLLTAFLVTCFVLLAISAGTLWLRGKLANTQPPLPRVQTPAVANATTIVANVSDNKGVVGNVTGNVYIDAHERHSQELTRVETETFLQANRGNIDRCLSRLSKRYYYIDFVFLQGDDGAVNMDVIPGENVEPEREFMHPQLRKEEVETYSGHEVLSLARSADKLSVSDPDVNGCIVGTLKNELARYSLKPGKGFVHRYITGQS